MCGHGVAVVKPLLFQRADGQSWASTKLVQGGWCVKAEDGSSA